MRINHYALTALLFCGLTGSALANPDSTKTPQADSVAITPKKASYTYIPFPVLGASPVTKFEYGFGSIVSYKLKHTEPTRPSYFYLYSSYTLNKQTLVNIISNTWTNNNRWHAYAIFSYSDYPLEFRWLPHDADGSPAIVNANRKRTLAFVEHKLNKRLYAGLAVQYTVASFKDLSEGDRLENSVATRKAGGKDVFVGGVLTYDTRDVENQTKKGEFFRAISVPTIGSGDYTTILNILDARVFRPIDSKQVIGAQAYFSSVQGKNIPFYSLAQLGNENLMRGYYSGSYTGQNYLVVQSEYRYTPWKQKPDVGIMSLSRFTVAGFAGIGDVFNNGSGQAGFDGKPITNNHFQWSDMKPTYGFGARYMFNPKGRMSFRIDQAWGKKGESGLYFAFNEAF